MERVTPTKLRIGEWCVDAGSGQISREGQTARVEARTMRVLVCLAERAGEVVSSEELLNRVWPDVTVSQDSVYQAVASLRRLLGDDPKQPAYIATVPRLGYRMVATVGPWTDSLAESGAAGTGISRGSKGEGPRQARSDSTTSGPRVRAGLLWAVAAVLGLALVVIVVVAFQARGKVANKDLAGASSGVVDPQTEKSVAVLPFLDLTEGMHEEEFADGMTEELIGKLSKVPGFMVPGPTSSFYFKGKQVPIADIAKKLGVAYVLDGSVRKSGGRIRVAARLVRADNGYVIWTESYDRPFDDILMVQDDIAGEVTKALRASIESGARAD
jgi:TolB-like protein/DNA-binding winged helix-turn-helix (wHTH) protein